ncbi:MAG: hypothetical protein ACLFSQ_04430 [Candidatus Zixiibacteriota bacterium]
MAEDKLQYDERILEMYDIPATDTGSKLAGILPIVTTIALVMFARYVPRADFQAIKKILESNNIEGIWAYALAIIAIAFVYLILLVIIPGLVKGAMILIRSSSFRYIFTNKRVIVKTTPKPIVNPKPGKPIPEKHQKKQQKKNESKEHYILKYNEISSYDAELDYIRIHLKPSFKMFYSGLHFATILGFPLRIHTPKGKGPEIASILLTHKQYT